MLINIVLKDWRRGTFPIVMNRTDVNHCSPGILPGNLTPPRDLGVLGFLKLVPWWRGAFIASQAQVLSAACELTPPKKLECMRFLDLTLGGGGVRPTLSYLANLEELMSR